ncbi:MAG: B12-binding domain-containing radical SAM protein [Gammaproteobacteria bacterium]|nr:B12-binding domain-containing radical SAM protein [Gammaproteobacteria bacterium]
MPPHSSLPQNPKILFLIPYDPKEDFHYAVPQIALGYLSSALKKGGYDNIEIFDLALTRTKPEQLSELLISIKPDIIAMRIWSHQLEIVDRYLEIIDLTTPKATIIAGGPHITVAPQWLQDQSRIEWAIAGEAEAGLPLLIDHLCGKEGDLNLIPGLVQRIANSQSETGIIKVNRFDLTQDLDQFEVDWEQLNLTAYHRHNGRTTAYDHGRSKNGFLFITRGCPYPCTYCASGITNGKKIREHSAKRVLDDIAHLYHHYGVRHFNIMDDNFTFHKRTVIDFCSSFLQRRSELPGVTFHNPNGVRIDRLDSEMVAMMSECGWKWLHIGLETGSKEMEKMIKKRCDLDKALVNIRMIKRHNIKIWGFFILGFPDETREQMEETISYAIDSDLDAATFSIFSPIPGTEIYQALQLSGKIPHNYGMSGYMVNTGQPLFPNLDSHDELKKIVRSALIRFYSRPDRAYHLLRGMSFSTIFNRFNALFLRK